MPDLSEVSKEAFTRHLQTLRPRLGMYLGSVTFDRLVTHILGYDLAIRDLGLPSPLDGLSELVALKYGGERAIGWMGITRHNFARDDAHAIELCFRFLDELIAIKATKDVQFIKDEFERMKKFKRKRATNLNWPNTAERRKK